MTICVAFSIALRVGYFTIAVYVSPFVVCLADRDTRNLESREKGGQHQEPTYTDGCRTENRSHPMAPLVLSTRSSATLSSRLTQERQCSLSNRLSRGRSAAADCSALYLRIMLQGI